VFSTNKSYSGYFDCNLTYWFKANLTAQPSATASPSPNGSDKNAPRAVNMGIGIDYENGDNPELSIKDANILTIAFQAKF